MSYKISPAHQHESIKSTVNVAAVYATQTQTSLSIAYRLPVTFVYTTTKKCRLNQRTIASFRKVRASCDETKTTAEKLFLFLRAQVHVYARA